jgi:hypothetical protein
VNNEVSKWRIYAAKGGNGEGDYHNSARYEIRRDHCIISESLDVNVEHTFDEVMALAKADCDERNAPPKVRRRYGPWEECEKKDAETNGYGQKAHVTTSGDGSWDVLYVHDHANYTIPVRLAAQSSGIPVAELREAMQITSNYPLEGLIKIRVLCDKYEKAGV